VVTSPARSAQSDPPARTVSPVLPGRLRVTTRWLDAPAPIPLLPGAARSPWAWVRGGDGLLAWGEAVRIPIRPGGGRFDDAVSLIDELARRSDIEDAVGIAGSGLIALGSFTFADDAEGSVLLVPRLLRGRRNGRDFLTEIGPPGSPPLDLPTPLGASRPVPARPRFGGSSRPDRDWLAAVAGAIERIHADDLDKVVLARDHLLWAESPFDIDGVLDRLAERFPSCYSFHLDGLVGATPELLVSRSGRRVTSRVLAGTAARGGDATTDAAIGAGLLASDKDLEEHAYAVDSVADVLRSRCARLDVDGPHLLLLDNVQHLATDVTGVLDDPGTSALELAGALHPTAAVGGSPRGPALTAIAELEGMDRGRYTGPVGWMDARGDGEWGIALRCAEVAGDRARLFAGAGIVAASIPEEELAETRLKLAAMRGVLGDGSR
jgi:menaquinone-specific isochorismate synthase